MGFFSVQNCSKSFLRDATDGKTQFRQGMARKTEASTDFGPAARHAATIIHIDLEMVCIFCSPLSQGELMLYPWRRRPDLVKVFVGPIL